MKRFIPSIICFIIAAIIFIALIGSSCTSKASAASVDTDIDTSEGWSYPISPVAPQSGLVGTFIDVFTSMWEFTEVKTGDASFDTTYMMKVDDFVEKMQELYKKNFPFEITKQIAIVGIGDGSYYRGIDLTDDFVDHVLTCVSGDVENSTLNFPNSSIMGFNYSPASDGSTLGWSWVKRGDFPTSPKFSCCYSDLPVFGAYNEYSTIISLSSFATTTDLYVGSGTGRNSRYWNGSSGGHLLYVLVSPATPDIYDIPLPPDGASDVYFTSNGGFSKSKLVAKVGDDFVTFDGQPTTDPMAPDDPGDTSGSMSGDVRVTGEIGVNGSVDVNVNVNTSDYLAPPEFDVTSYLTESPKSFIDYMENFFSFLPATLVTLLVSGVAAAIFMRLWGR